MDGPVSRPAIHTIKVMGEWVHVECTPMYPRGWMATVIGSDERRYSCTAPTLADALERIETLIGKPKAEA